MLDKHLLPLLLASLFAASTAHAAIDLIAIGSVSGSYEDFAIETAGPLENGVPGNRLGGRARSQLSGQHVEREEGHN